MSNSNLFLCFQGDGPYWKDLVYVPAYPAGFSYAKWAFRYDQSRWVAPALEAEATAQQQKKIQTAGILGVRFYDSRQELLLPLRRIDVTWIDLTGGITQFYFRVQALLDFTKFDSLEQTCLVLPSEELAEDGQVKSALAFRSSVETSSLPWSPPDAEDRAWSKLLDLVATNNAVPLRPEVKSATYFRFSNLSEAKKGTFTASELETSQGKGPIYGARLKEGREYQIKLTHRIFSDERRGTAPILPIKLELPTTHLQLTEPSLEVLGWYQTTPIVFRALRADQVHQILLVRSDKKKEESKPGATETQDVESDVYLPIPLFIGIDWLYRLRKSWALRAGLAIVLTIQASVAYFKDFLDKLLEGKASLSDLTHYWPIVLLLLFLGSIASIFVTLLSDHAKSKD